MKKIRRAGRRGQALIEVLVAISILAVGFMGIVTLLARALSLNRVVADNYTATYLASEGIELTKNIIDANLEAKRGWGAGLSENSNGFEVDVDSTNSLLPNSGRTLLIDPSTGEYSYTGLQPTPFRRKIMVKLVSGGQEEIQVNSIVTWATRGGGESSINLEDHFFNWR
jgi:prepilin-type N-terminal cleavage/methylation domain-containing protein